MHEPIIVMQNMNAPVEVIWRAITEREQMKQWYFDIDKFRAEEGFVFSFEGGTESTPYTHLCTITEVQPCQKLSYTWRYVGYDGDTLVSFFLQPITPQQTMVTLTHSGIESFGNSHPDLAKSNFEEGWQHIIKVALKDFAEQQQTVSSSTNTTEK
jgi:uncharacterized protein YndB with AHSA1/START domain